MASQTELFPVTTPRLSRLTVICLDDAQCPEQKDVATSRHVANIHTLGLTNASAMAVDGTRMVQ